MIITEQELRQRYETMTTDQLVALQLRGTLTEMAQNVLESVLRDRNVTPELKSQVIAEVTADKEKAGLLASYGARFFGHLLDWLLFLLIAPLPGTFFVVMALATKSNMFYQLAVVFTIAISLGYLLFSDAMPNGQSIGKRTLGIATVDAITLKPCHFGQAFLRNAFRFILGPIDLITMGNKKRQRVGDLVAGTVVVNLQVLKARNANI